MAEDQNGQEGQGSDPSLNNNEPTQDQQPSNPPAQSSEPTGQGQNAGSSDPTQGGHSDANERAKARENGKLQQVQDQFNRVANWVAQDPDRLYDAYKNTSGMNDQEALNAVRQVHPNYQGTQSSQQAPQQNQYNLQGQQQVPNTGGPQQPPTQQQGNQNLQAMQNNPQLSEHERAALARMAAEEEKKATERQSAIAEFKEQYGDKVDYTDKQAIVAMAVRFENKGNTPKEALEMAKTYVLEPEKLREEGEIEGMGRAYSQMGSSQSGSGSGTSSRSGGSSLSKMDTQVMQALGLDRDKDKKEAFMNKVQNS